MRQLGVYFDIHAWSLILKTVEMVNIRTGARPAKSNKRVQESIPRCRLVGYRGIEFLDLVIAAFESLQGSIEPIL